MCLGLWLQLKGQLLIFEVNAFPLLKFRLLQMLSDIGKCTFNIISVKKQQLQTDHQTDQVRDIIHITYLAQKKQTPTTIGLLAPWALETSDGYFWLFSDIL